MESVGYQLNATNIVSIVFVLVFVAARLLTKAFVTRSTGWDDYTCVIAALIGIGRTINDTIAVQRYGMGRHSKDIRTDQYTGLFTCITVDTALYFVAVAFGKLAILIFLYRVFSVNTKFRWFCWFLGPLILLWAVISSLMALFSCTPVKAKYSYEFQQAHPDGFKCINIGNIIFYYGWFNTVTDFVELLLPMPIIWKLQLVLSKKIGVAIVFATGAFVCAVSVYRLYVLHVNSQEEDGTWHIVESKIWLTIEVNITIIVSCLPTLQPLFRRAFQSIFPSSPSDGSRKPSFVLQNPPQKDVHRIDSPSRLGLRLTPDGGRSDSEVEQGSTNGREMSVSAMYHQKDPYREFAGV